VVPTPRPALDAEGVAEAARPSLVAVESLDRRHNVVAQGSGVIVGKKIVVTPWTLVSRASAIRIRHNRDVHSAVIDAVLEDQGLARLSADALGPIELARDAYPWPGSTVYAAGPGQGALVALSEGIVSGISGRPGKAMDRIETTVPLTAALTGAALLNANGELIGIVAPSGTGDAGRLGVPVRYVKDLLSLPSGTLPRATSSPLTRLPTADRKWLISFMGRVVREGRPLGGLDLDRATALLDRIEPLVGAELAWAKVEMGFGWLSYQRVFWEDAVEAHTFRRVVKSPRRTVLEKNLVSLQIVTPGEITEGDGIMRAIAAHEPFEAPGARILADERWLAERLGRTDELRRRVETELWEARNR
jgi:S1-C subfamily serine protease